MDNEASTALKMIMTTMDNKYQLVPPSKDRAKKSYRSIQTITNHFIVGLYIVDKDLQLKLWDILLHQAKNSLNLLRQSRILSQLSAYTNIYGEFDYNRTLLAPPVKIIVIYNRQNDRAS